MRCRARRARAPRWRRRPRAILRDVRRDGDRALVRLTARFDRVRAAPGRPARAAGGAAGPVPPRGPAAGACAARDGRARRGVPPAAARRRVRGPPAGRIAAGGGGVAARFRGALRAGRRRRLPLVRAHERDPGARGRRPARAGRDAAARARGQPGGSRPRCRSRASRTRSSAWAARRRSAPARTGPGACPRSPRSWGRATRYVAEAKRQVRGVVEIDQEAGPSEVVILADDTRRPRLGRGRPAGPGRARQRRRDGRAGDAVRRRWPAEVARLVALGIGSVANRASARRALDACRGAIVLVRDLDEGVAAVNALAPEHAEVMTRGARRAGDAPGGGRRVRRAPCAPVAVGDYGIGPNHVLPTGGAARYSSPLSVRDFQRRQSRVQLTAPRPAPRRRGHGARGAGRGLPRARAERCSRASRDEDLR